MANAIIRFRRGTAAQWTETNIILLSGEPGYEVDTGRQKIGDGFTRWVDLPYYTILSDVEIELDTHVNSLTPHPVYDDGPSLFLLYENAKV